MKRLLLFLSLCFICTAAIAHTINWYVDGSVYHTTTCESGENVTPPTAPEKYGYTFRGWKDVTPVEYIANTGVQYIDIGVQPTDTLILNITLMFEAYGAIFGARTSEAHSMFAGFDANAGLYLDYGSGYNLGRIAYLEKIQLNSIYRLSYGNRYIKNLNTGDFFVSESPVSFTPINLHLYLFSLNSNNNAAIGSTDTKVKKIRLYDMQIFNNNTLIRDFIPVLDSNGVPCMYDRIENKLYYNAGKGSFIAGPIIGE
ncbi:MAG: InlB B-repeat-containing protein [Alphaproteobacteria bacterium]|nr:InlB B-repeat-containing protein [Alphaproteobacteria bacterium]